MPLAIKLHKMIDVFTLRDIERLGCGTAEWAKLRAHRWHEQQLVRPAGPRSGIYYNLVRRPEAESNAEAWDCGMMAKAINIAYPGAVLIGATVLHRSGWSATPPRTHVVAALPARTRLRLHGVLVVSRPHEWFAAHHPFQRIDNLPALAPEQALSDLHRYGSKDGLHAPEDLIFPEQGDLDLGGKSSRAGRPALLRP